MGFVKKLSSSKAGQPPSTLYLALGWPSNWISKVLRHHRDAEGAPITKYGKEPPPIEDDEKREDKKG
jgi:hypothetical protein